MFFFPKGKKGNGYVHWDPQESVTAVVPDFLHLYFGFLNRLAVSFSEHLLHTTPPHRQTLPRMNTGRESIDIHERTHLDHRCTVLSLRCTSKKRNQ